MQMPLDFSVYARDGQQYDFHVPNTWFTKRTTATVLPKWYGWDKIRTLASVKSIVAASPSHARILTGDFNEDERLDVITASWFGDVAYLLATWHPDTRPPCVGDLANQEWLGLTIHEAPPPEGDVGFVRFTAKLREKGAEAAIRERSRFLKENGRWFYVDGDIR